MSQHSLNDCPPASFMTVEEALVLLDTVLEGQNLKDIQEKVFRYSWHGWTYEAIAHQLGYDTGHIRDVGSQLWQQLSQLFGELVTKKNLQTVLRRQHQRKQKSIAPIYSFDNRLMIASDSANTSNFTSSLTTKSDHSGEASLEVAVFYGRRQEITQLQHWIVQDQCRLIAIVGMGEMERNSLTRKLSEHFPQKVNSLIWQSLDHALLLEDTLPILLQYSDQISSQPMSIAAQVFQLIEYLRTSQYLLILARKTTY
ncbi:hypothetical protein ACKFKF_22670 [Phormidesmis sp. 146-12]